MQHRDRQAWRELPSAAGRCGDSDDSDGVRSGIKSTRPPCLTAACVLWSHGKRGGLAWPTSTHTSFIENSIEAGNLHSTRMWSMAEGRECQTKTAGAKDPYSYNHRQ